MAEILDVTETTFDAEVLGSTQPVLVDFWAEWCAPCRQLTPTLKGLAAEYDGRVRVVKVDSDANADLTAKYNVRSLPTVLLVKGGQIRGALIGNQPRATLVKHVEELLEA